MIKNGETCIFDYPAHFTTLPEYTAHRGQTVTIVRPLTEDEAHPPVPEEGITQMYLIRAADGWEGHAWEEELLYQEGSYSLVDTRETRVFFADFGESHGLSQ